MRPVRHSIFTFVIGASLLAFMGAERAAASEPSPMTSGGAYGSVRQSPYSSKGYSSSGYRSSGYSAAGLSSRGMSARGYSTKGLSSSSFNNEQFGSVRQSTYHARSGGSADGSLNANSDEGQASRDQQAAEPQNDTNTISNSAVCQDQAASDAGQITVAGNVSSQGNAAYGAGPAITFRRVMSVPGAGETEGKARFGSIVTKLPAGCVQVRVQNSTYYYKDGYFYNPFSSNGVWSYAVVPPSLGITVFELPSGCAARVIGGVNYYTVSGIYYRPAFVDGRVAYIVVSPPR